LSKSELAKSDESSTLSTSFLSSLLRKPPVVETDHQRTNWHSATYYLDRTKQEIVSYTTPEQQNTQVACVI
jgi:hypothetical protein